MKRYIFLDIDGVLTSARVHMAHGDNGVWRTLDPVALRFISDLTIQWDAEIIISSTWRRLHKYEDFRDIFTGTPIWHRLHSVWCTPRKPLEDFSIKCRGDEIALWLKQNAPSEYEYIIFDDDSDFHEDQLKRLVKCDPLDGMLTAAYDKALDLTQMHHKLHRKRK